MKYGKFILLIAIIVSRGSILEEDVLMPFYRKLEKEHKIIGRHDRYTSHIHTNQQSKI